MGNKIIEVHALVNTMPSLLNRGENNEAKTITIGGVKRARISSQCMKYAMTLVDNKRKFVATRKMPEILKAKLMNDNAIENKEEILAIIDEVSKILFIDAVTRYTDAEIEDIYKAICNKNIYASCKKPAEKAKIIKEAVDSEHSSRRMQESIAVWGRFTANGDNIGYTNDSAVHMSHAISIDEYFDDRDFFTAVDSYIAENDELTGAGMLQSSDISSNVMYKYMNVSPVIAYENMAKGLMDNNVDALADELVDAVLKFIVVSPIAKQHSNASNERPGVVYITVGEVAPITMGGRFQKVIFARRNKSVMEQGIEKFMAHIKDDAYECDDRGYEKRYAILLSEYEEYKAKFKEMGVTVLNLNALKAELKKDILDEFVRLS